MNSVLHYPSNQTGAGLDFIVVGRRVLTSLRFLCGKVFELKGAAEGIIVVTLVLMLVIFACMTLIESSMVTVQYCEALAKMVTIP